MFLIYRLHVHNSKTNAYNLLAVENTNILKWNERLNIAVDAAYGNVLFITTFFLHCVPLHCT